jgi:hypothetical protein
MFIQDVVPAKRRFTGMIEFVPNKDKYFWYVRKEGEECKYKRLKVKG